MWVLSRPPLRFSVLGPAASEDRGTRKSAERKMWGTCHHLVMMMIMCATIIIMIKMIMIRNHLVLVVSRRNGDDDGNMSQFDDCGENDASPFYT